MRKRKRILGIPADEVPMSSMIDVVFLILIYFILIQKPILDETLLKANLPDDGPPKKLKIITPTVIDVFEEKGDFYRLNGRAYDNEVLFKILKDISDNNPEKQIIINCGANAKHQKLINLLDKCAEINLKNLNIINDRNRTLKE